MRASLTAPVLAAAQMFYKAARVEYHPLGVVGAIVPWNYPFHNVFNPLSAAALFAGNAIVIKVGAHACCCSCTSDATFLYSSITTKQYLFLHLLMIAFLRTHA